MKLKKVQNGVTKSKPKLKKVAKTVPLNPQKLIITPNYTGQWRGNFRSSL